MSPLPTLPEAPRPGCTDCHARGHYCPGMVTADDGATWLCWPCDSGVKCAHERAKEKPSKVERVNALADRDKANSARTGLKAARILKARPAKKEPTVKTHGEADLQQGLREKYDHDEPEATAEEDLPPAITPQASEVRFITREEAAADRLNAVTVVIHDLREDRARLAVKMRELDDLLEQLEEKRAEWAA